jgi:hypothetical protein
MKYVRTLYLTVVISIVETEVVHHHVRFAVFNCFFLLTVPRLSSVLPGRSNTSEDTCGPRVLDPPVKTKTSTLASNFVKTSPGYLRTLSQTHAGWIFGAIAELIDNSRDAGASRYIHVFKVL